MSPKNNKPFIPSLSLRVFPRSTSIVEAFFEISSDHKKEAVEQINKKKIRREKIDKIMEDLLMEDALYDLLDTNKPEISLVDPPDVVFYGIKDSNFSASQAREQILKSRMEREDRWNNDETPPSP